MPARIRLPTRQLLTDVVAAVSPDFLVLPNQRDYWFRRGPTDLAFDFIVIQSSQKHACYSVDVVATVFPTWDCKYGGHLLRRATGLPNVRANSSMIPMEDTIYTHDGTTDGARRTLQRIQSELVEYALPWFKEFKDSIANDRLVQYGFEWLHQNKTRIAKQDKEMSSATIATHPLLDELKQSLFRFAWDSELPKRHRQEAGILAYDLIHFAELDTQHEKDA